MNQAVLTSPARPLVAIVGGAKVSSKLPVLSSLVEKCDSIVIGGAMCFTFLKALGHGVGSSLVEEAQLEMAAALLKQVDGPRTAHPSQPDPGPPPPPAPYFHAEDGIREGVGPLSGVQSCALPI